MDPSLVFDKTAKGREELESRRYHLDSRHRLALILVDGRSDLKTLHGKAESMTDLETLLEDLVTQGFISTAGAAARPAVTATGSPREQARHELVNVATLVLGKDADKAIKVLREAGAGHDALVEASQRVVKLVQLTIDEGKAGELRAKFQALLNRPS